jgi:hypothetical protein
MWGPVFGWCVLELLAKSIDAENSERLALDLFDRLRLREPFAQAFTALGFEAEEGWRAAARIKVLLLSRAAGKAKDLVAEHTSSAVVGAAADRKAINPRKPTTDKPAAGKQGVVEEEQRPFPHDLWLDPDVRWLTGVHQAQGQDYLVREPYEELLWWLLLPAILRQAGEQAVNRKAAKELSEAVEEALNKAEATGYRVDAMLGPSAAPDAVEAQEPVTETQAAEKEKPQTKL